MRAISLFSGVGGLELPGANSMLCEIDPECREVLRLRFPESRIHDDVMTLDPPRADVVFGGWPCQDLSVAGLRRGLAGEKSGLFFRMVDIAIDADVGTLVAENVPNLLKLENGENFRLVVEYLQRAGFKHVAWRSLNARQFGLPHQRRRIFIIASQDRQICLNLFRKLPRVSQAKFKEDPSVVAFYWTAGLQGINLSRGFSPTLKVGSSLSIPSPPAILYKNRVRQISAREAILLQGFRLMDFKALPDKAIYRMMGNAVARPVGRFVAESVNENSESVPDSAFIPLTNQAELFSDILNSTSRISTWPDSGFIEGEEVKRFVEDKNRPLCNSLEDLVDLDDDSELSARAANGLLSRLSRSGKACPDDLRKALTKIACP